MLQTSLDKTINLSTLNFLGTILPLTDLSSSTISPVVAGCFNTFSSCFTTGHDLVTMVTRGSEQLAGVSVMCFLRAFYCLSNAEPTSAVIKDVRQRYKRVFPSRADLRGLPCPIVMRVIHNLFGLPLEPLLVDWSRYDSSTDELVPFSHALAQAARFEYPGEGGKPEWLVRFAFRFLSQDPLPPTSVVIDCLTIVSANLGCNVSNTASVALDERCVYTSKTIVPPLTVNQCTA